MSGQKGVNKLEWSAIFLIAGILLLFFTSVAVTLIAPSHIDPSWKQASSVYQIQMYEISDPHMYVSTANPASAAMQHVYHIQKGFTPLCFQESTITKIVASEPELEKYITHVGDKILKITTRPLLLKKVKETDVLRKKWQNETTHLEIFELYDPRKSTLFAVTDTDGVVEFWTNENYEILGESPPYDADHGLIYINNPREYRFAEVNYYGTKYWMYKETGQPVENLEQLKKGRFISRESLIKMGEEIYRVEGCWYCHTDQSRTLIQDAVLNGSAEYPAPPSSANEYVFQRVTFPGTRRIGPDLSRVGIKRPNRDWHLSHFWEPRTESKGSIMPSFRHFFDKDPSGAPKSPYGIANYRFEAILHYLMTKGTRITPPDKAWWLGKDPIQTIDIIEGRK